MNSQQKLNESASNEADFAVKIEREIRRYQLRYLVAQEECKAVEQNIKENPKLWDMIQLWKRKRSALKEEMNLCTEQVRAYKTGDNKAKLIPDRLL